MQAQLALSHLQELRRLRIVSAEMAQEHGLADVIKGASATSYLLSRCKPEEYVALLPSQMQSCTPAHAERLATAGLQSLRHLEALSIEIDYWRGGPGHRGLEVPAAHRSRPPHSWHAGVALVPHMCYA